MAGVLAPRHLRFEVTSRRQERMVVHEELQCTSSSDDGHWHKTERRIVGKPPIRRRVRIPGDPLACIFGVRATRHDFAGWMAITLFGEGTVFDRTGRN
jgi:hypothetical protein